MNRRVPARQIKLIPHSREYGGVTWFPGVSGDIWGNASGYLTRWCQEAEAAGQLYVVRVEWEDGVQYERDITLEAEATYDLGAWLLERLESDAKGRARTYTGAPTQFAQSLVSEYDFGRHDAAETNALERDLLSLLVRLRRSRQPEP